MPELEAMVNDICNNPESKVGASGLNLFNKAAVKKMDEITWAMYSIRKNMEPEFIRKASNPEIKNW